MVMKMCHAAVWSKDREQPKSLKSILIGLDLLLNLLRENFSRKIVSYRPQKQEKIKTKLKTTIIV